jgi:hypothetical protein
VRAHRIHHALHISIFYFSHLLHVGGSQGILPVLVKNVMPDTDIFHIVVSPTPCIEHIVITRTYKNPQRMHTLELHFLKVESEYMSAYKSLH